jgi:hypothetical protein
VSVPLLTSLDRSLQQRAKANAAAAVEEDEQHAAERQEAATALEPNAFAPDPDPREG